MSLIRLENIHKTYHLGEVDVPVLRGVSLSIEQGELVALMGASGSGKTTLMNILGCLDRPTAGQFWFDGQEMSELSPNQRALVRTEKLGFVFQSFNLLSRTSALGNVLMPLDYSLRRPSSENSRHLARQLLGHVGLAERSDHEPSQMSGGQQQRVAIGRALVNRPRLLLADEPTGNLDSHTSVEILHLFQRLNSEGITVVLVTHDIKVAAYAHRTIRIADGRVESDSGSRSNGSGLTRRQGIWDDQSASPLLRVETLVFASAATTAQAETDGDVCESLDDRFAAAKANTGQTVQCVAAASGGDAGSDAPADAGHNAAVATLEAPSAATEISRHASARPSLYGEVVAPTEPRFWSMPVSLLPTFRTALDAIRRNTMRSALTALGIIIGVGAVIAMTELGQGSKTAIEQTVASMGANMILLRPGAVMTGGVSLGSGTAMSLTPADVEEIIRQCPSIAQVAPIVGTRAQLIYAHHNWVPDQIAGTTPAFFIARDWQDLDEGEMFTERDVRNVAKVCVIGETVRNELFGDASPIGEEIRVQNVPLRVIGVLSRKGANMWGSDQDDCMLAPWTTVKYRVCATLMTNVNQSAAIVGPAQITSLNQRYPGSVSIYPTASALQAADTPQPVRFASVGSILIKARSADAIPQAMEEISTLLRERHHLRPEQPDDFNLRDMTEATKALASTSQLMTILLVVVATISLAVGGVGIMNIMLVSVTERTREIGLRMAVGARTYHILRQFLVEAVVLCLFGGAIGILLGRGASVGVRYFLHWPTEASLLAVIAAAGVSASVGVVFGFYPAWKASRLDPIEALRYE